MGAKISLGKACMEYIGFIGALAPRFAKSKEQNLANTN